MKTTEFREYSTPEILQDLVETTLLGESIRLRIKTPKGDVCRTVRGIDVGETDAWKKIKSPALIARHIPGLDSFTCPSIRVGTRITEQHGMFFGTNAYEGKLFHYDPKNMVWGMTNHPVQNNNSFDIPHNVVYSFNEQNARVSIGVDYCASGRLESFPSLGFLADFVARASMRYAIRKVEKGLTN